MTRRSARAATTARGARVVPPRQEPLQGLERVGLLAGLSPEEVRHIGRTLAVRSFRLGQVIFATGDPSDQLFILQRGHVKVVAVTRNGDEKVVRLYKAGQVFGEMCLVLAARRLRATALDDVTAVALPKEAVRQLLASVPSLGFNLVRLLLNRLARTEQELIDFAHAWSDRKLARLLLSMADEHGEAIPEGTLIPLPLTHQMLADMMGTSRVTVSQHLRRFVLRGLVRVHGRRLVVDKPRLLAYPRSG